MDIFYAPSFIRQLQKLDENLQKEAIEKIILMKDIKNHRDLVVHKLKGRLAGRYSFSVNFKYRVIFQHTREDAIVLLAIGDHKIYQ